MSVYQDIDLSIENFAKMYVIIKENKKELNDYLTKCKKTLIDKIVELKIGKIDNDKFIKEIKNIISVLENECNNIGINIDKNVENKEINKLIKKININIENQIAIFEGEEWESEE